MTLLRRIVRRIPGARPLAQALGLVPDLSRKFVLDALPRDGVGAEIGVHLGEFSERILAVARPSRLLLVDPWEHRDSADYEGAWYGGKATEGQREMDRRHGSVRDRFESEIREGRVEIHRGYSAEILAGFPDGHFDWIYIDGDHLYESVRADIRLSFAKVREGGVIAGDDYVEGNWWAGGVKRALDEFAGDHPELTVKIRDRQFVIQR